MKQKPNTHENFNSITFPFTTAHFRQFRKELNQAGSFDLLMLKKKALSGRMGMKYISLYKDIEKYKAKYLTGQYANLQPMYDTEMPYIFWSALYETLLLTEKKGA